MIPSNIKNSHIIIVFFCMIDYILALILSNCVTAHVTRGSLKAKAAIPLLEQQKSNLHWEPREKILQQISQHTALEILMSLGSHAYESGLLHVLLQYCIYLGKERSAYVTSVLIINLTHSTKETHYYLLSNFLLTTNK